MRRRTAAIIATLAFLAGGTAGRFSVRVASTRTVVAVVDAEVPGTKVFHRGQYLGEVPLELTRERLAELGLDRTRSRRAEKLDVDGWCEAMFFGEEDEDELKLMRQVPDADEARFLSIETPWGRRTKMASWRPVPEHPYGEEVTCTRAGFYPAETADGLRFRVGLPQRVESGTKTVTVELTCHNAGRGELTGRRPSYWLLWGGFDTPWRRRVCLKDLLLPREWERIAPGQTVRAAFKMDVPQVAGDYSVFAAFGYEEPPTGNERPSVGSYSNSALLRVR